MLSQTSIVTEILRWLQIIGSIIYPFGVVIILLLAWLDFRRWVNSQITRDRIASRADEELEREVREFSE